MTRRTGRLMDAAVASDRLVDRAAANAAYGGADFEGWMGGLIEGLTTRRVLDLCCGTGNQLVLYAARPDSERLAGVDLSAESLATARARLGERGYGGELILECRAMEEVFAGPPFADARFDLISCCYGLYYAANAGAVLDAMLAHLAPGGTVMIVGPHGDNNRNFFDLLRRHMELPDLVVRSATTFMPDEVVPRLDGGDRARIETFVNPVTFPDAEAVIAYWRKSTFHDRRAEAAVRRDLDAHFAEHDGFVIEKHVMACMACR